MLYLLRSCTCMNMVAGRSYWLLVLVAQRCALLNSACIVGTLHRSHIGRIRRLRAIGQICSGGHAVDAVINAQALTSLRCTFFVALVWSKSSSPVHRTS